MRITHSQIAELLEILSRFKLRKDFFSIKIDDAVCYIKYKGNYFDFRIHKTSTVNYECSVRWIDQKAENKYNLNWQETKNFFGRWTGNISDEIKHAPEFKTPQLPDKIIPKQIARYSRRFVKVYSQALAAEDAGLDEICGLGYRKAFECLMRDYLLKKYPSTEHDKIKSMPVAQCIKSYVTSDEVKLLALRVFWLGNDHAHYLKKWKGKSVGDLKKLIALTLKWIESKDELEKVLNSMP